MIANSDGFSCMVHGVFKPHPYGFLSSGFAVPQVVTRVRDHPVYSAIEDKSNQAKKWNIGDVPLVVCVGNTQESGFFHRRLYPDVSAMEAALAALHDTSRWHPITQANHVPRTEGKNLRVSGAARISGVLLVSVEDRPLGVGMGYQRTAEMQFIRNGEGTFPLSPKQHKAVGRLSFGRIRFANDGAPYEAVRNRNNPRRAHHAGKTMSIANSRRDGSVEVVIPEQDLVWILSGKATPAEVFTSYGGEKILRSLEQEPPIQSIERVPGNAEHQEPDRIKVVFGPPRQRLY